MHVPDDYVIESLIAIGRRADKSVLNEDLQGLESPNQRLPLAALITEGPFAAA